MTFKMLLLCLVEAEARRNDKSLPGDVRGRAAETVRLLQQRMAMEGITRAQLEALAAEDGASA